MPKLNGLSLKQRKFVGAYLGEAAGNGTKAAQLAGYRGSPQTLRAVASENLTKPYVASEIKRCMQTTMTAEQVLNGLSAIASAECREAVRVAEKLKALDLLAKYHRLYNESIDVKVEQIDAQEVTIVLQQAISAFEPTED